MARWSVSNGCGGSVTGSVTGSVDGSVNGSVNGSARAFLEKRRVALDEYMRQLLTVKGIARFEKKNLCRSVCRFESSVLLLSPL